MSTVNVFTYGSLMYAPVWEKVCVGLYPTRKLILRDFQRYCIKGESYPAVIPQPGASVEGLVYLDVTLADQLKLHQFEGDEYVFRHHQIDELSIGFYEYVALSRIERRDWNPSEFEQTDLPAFLHRQVGNFLDSGTRKS
jgi:gamma-glutamylcyclotransferase (GGCT)/AIG2-like uncharacterized protein YtfP